MHEAKNIKADQRNNIAIRLEEALQRRHPHIQINHDTFFEYERLVLSTVNMNTWYVKARDIIKAHLDSNLLKSQAPVLNVLRALKGLNDFNERNGIAHAPMDATAIIADMLENGKALGNADRVTAAQTARDKARLPALKRT